MSFLVDVDVRARMESFNVSPDSELDHHIQILNAVMEGRRKDMNDLCVGIHLCRGNLTVSLSCGEHISISDYHFYWVSCRMANILLRDRMSR